MTAQAFDAIVIGAGPAGEVAAGRLAQRGKAVALVEQELVGGECSYYACMPSKALLRPGELLDEVARVPGAAEALAGRAVDAPAALRAMADAATARGEALRKLADASQPLYASLDQDQKRRAMILARPMGPMGGHGMGGHGMGGHGMGGRWHRGHDDDRGPGGDDR